MDQVKEFNKSQGFSLSYTSSKVEEVNIHNEATRPSNMPNLYGEGVNNYSTNTWNLQGLKTSSISYRNN